MTNVTDNEYFARYFHMRADLAEELEGRGFSADASIIATTALDALGEVWLHDFHDERKVLEQEFGGGIQPSIRMARLVKRFAPGTPHVDKVAVVLLAEDWLRYIPTAAADATALLAPRRPRFHGELPHAHLDVAKHALLLECPALGATPRLSALVEEYEYSALLYRFFRSPFVHYGTRAPRTHGFTEGNEVFYMPLGGQTTIGISIGVVTAWLRAASSAYTIECARRGIRPATALNSAVQGEERLASKWQRVASG